MARSRFAVFGAGRYGTQIALSLARRGAEVFTFDANADRADCSEDVSQPHLIQRNAHSPQHVQTSTQPLSPLRTRGHRSPHSIAGPFAGVIVRANDANQERILSGWGSQKFQAQKAKWPSGQRASHQPQHSGFLSLPDDYEIAELKAPLAAGPSIATSNWRNDMNSG